MQKTIRRSCLTYLERCVRCIVWQYETEVCAVFLEFVFLSHLRGQMAISNHCLEIVALTPVFHSDVKVLLVTSTSDCW